MRQLFATLPEPRPPAATAAGDGITAKPENKHPGERSCLFSGFVVIPLARSARARRPPGLSQREENVIRVHPRQSVEIRVSCRRVEMPTMLRISVALVG